MKISDETHKAACRAALDAYHEWNAADPFDRCSFAALVEGAGARAVEAVAPLIAAQVLREAADAVEDQHSFPYGDSGDPEDWAGAVARFLRNRG
jgi:hypothetical protein